MHKMAQICNSALLVNLQGAFKSLEKLTMKTLREVDLLLEEKCVLRVSIMS